MAQYSDVDCWAIHKSESFATGTAGTSASVTLGCTWANRYLLAQDLIGYRRTWPGALGTGAPRVENVTNMRGWGEATVQPGSADQVFDYVEAHMDVSYAPLAADIPATPGSEDYDLILESLEGEVDGKRLDHRRFIWSNAAVPPANPDLYLVPGESPVKQVNRMKWSREFIGLANIPASTYALIGKVNIAPFVSTILGTTFAAETLRFNYPQASRSVRVSGDSGWNIKMSMSFKEEGWNKFWRVKGGTGDGGYEEIYIQNGPVYKNYPLADFNSVLNP